MRRFARIDDLHELVGESLGSSDWITVDQPRIDAFAASTDDRQWIHTDPQRAVAGPFGATIAHGFLTLSLLPAFFETTFSIADSRMGLNYGLNRVRFPAPAPVDSRLRAHMRLLDCAALRDGAQLTVEVTVEREGSSKPVCVAESLIRHLR